MIHPSDEELLELALSDERDAEVESHLRACGECRGRFEAVEAEQALIRRALEPASAPPRAWRRPVWPIAATAASGLVALGSMFFAMSVRATPRPSPAESREKLRAAVETVRASGSTESVDAAYAQCIADVIDLAEPLSAGQRDRIREIVAGVTHEEDAERAVSEYDAAMRDLLSAAQYAEFRRFVDEEVEMDREADVHLLVEEIGMALDLRYSEAAKLHDAVDERYPRYDLGGLFLVDDPAFELIHEAALADAVREALPRRHRDGFDLWLETVRAEHDAAHGP